MNEKQFAKYLTRLAMRNEVVRLQAMQSAHGGPYRIVVDHDGVPVIVETGRFRHKLLPTREDAIGYMMMIAFQQEVDMRVIDADGAEATFAVHSSFYGDED